MFWNKKQQEAAFSLGCCLGEDRYSLAAVKNNQELLFTQRRVFNQNTVHTLQKTLADDVKRLNLIAQACQLVLFPPQYQLILMDALKVPEEEMAQALRWSLKGLSDYDLDDVALDVFLVPAQQSDGAEKAVVAITPLSALNDKRALFESVFLDVTRVSIAEMALKNLLMLMQSRQALEADVPTIVISACDTVYTLHIVYQEKFYLIRTLELKLVAKADDPNNLSSTLFELERSIEYCVTQLNLPEPKQLFFTPHFYWLDGVFQAIEEKLAINVGMINLADYLEMTPPLSLEEQAGVFFSIAGALRFNHNEY